MRELKWTHLERHSDLGCDEPKATAEEAVQRDGGGRAADIGVDDVRKRARVDRSAHVVTGRSARRIPEPA